MLGVKTVILMDYEDGMLTSYPEAQLREVRLWMSLTQWQCNHRPAFLIVFFC